MFVAGDVLLVVSDNVFNQSGRGFGTIQAQNQGTLAGFHVFWHRKTVQGVELNCLPDGLSLTIR
jgi:hypothetical protein